MFLFPPPPLQYHNGHITTTAIPQLCLDLGTVLTHPELEAAIVLLDREATGFVDVQDFTAWWRGEKLLVIDTP